MGLSLRGASSQGGAWCLDLRSSQSVTAGQGNWDVTISTSVLWPTMIQCESEEDTSPWWPDFGPYLISCSALDGGLLGTSPSRLVSNSVQLAVGVVSCILSVALFQDCKARRYHVLAALRHFTTVFS